MRKILTLALTGPEKRLYLVEKVVFCHVEVSYGIVEVPSHHLAVLHVDKVVLDPVEEARLPGVVPVALLGVSDVAWGLLCPCNEHPLVVVGVHVWFP